VVTVIFIAAALGLLLYMIRYARRYGAGQTRDTTDDQYGWDKRVGQWLRQRLRWRFRQLEQRLNAVKITPT
jgi:hypothetical protein